MNDEKRPARAVLTAGIGALERFEKHFGAVWGHGKQDADLTDGERHWSGVWQDARGAILDHTNAVIRRLENRVS